MPKDLPEEVEQRVLWSLSDERRDFCGTRKYVVSACPPRSRLPPPMGYTSAASVRQGASIAGCPCHSGSPGAPLRLFPTPNELFTVFRRSAISLHKSSRMIQSWMVPNGVRPCALIDDYARMRVAPVVGHAAS